MVVQNHVFSVFPYFLFLHAKIKQNSFLRLHNTGFWSQTLSRLEIDSFRNPNGHKFTFQILISTLLCIFPCSKRHGKQFQNKMQVLEEISREETFFFPTASWPAKFDCQTKRSLQYHILWNNKKDVHCNCYINKVVTPLCVYLD